MKVLAVQYHNHYESTDLIGICISDVELAKRIAQTHYDELYNVPERELAWYENQYGSHIADLTNSNYSIVPYEVTEQ